MECKNKESFIFHLIVKKGELINTVRFEILILVSPQITVFLDVTSYNLIDVCHACLVL
jgi:hypothetical protein